MSLLQENENLRKQVSILKQKKWATKDDSRTTAYFVLVDTKYKPQTPAETARAKEYADEWMQDFKASLNNVVTFNKKSHNWDSQYIDDVNIKYVTELGLGRIKLDGTVGKTGKTIHIHIYIKIDHKSNITITQPDLYEFFKSRITYDLGSDNIYVSRPRLIGENRVFEYMTKSFDEAKWSEV